jgi:hypothetical protein
MIAVGLVLFSVQSVIRAWRSPPQAPIADSIPVDQEQPVPEPVIPEPAVPASETHDFLSDVEAVRQRENAEREIRQRRAKEAQENPAAVSITNEPMVR